MNDKDPLHYRGLFCTCDMDRLRKDVPGFPVNNNPSIIGIYLIWLLLRVKTLTLTLTTRERGTETCVATLDRSCRDCGVGI